MSIYFIKRAVEILLPMHLTDESLREWVIKTSTIEQLNWLNTRNWTCPLEIQTSWKTIIISVELKESHDTTMIGILFDHA